MPRAKAVAAKKVTKKVAPKKVAKKVTKKVVKKTAPKKVAKKAPAKKATKGRGKKWFSPLNFDNSWVGLSLYPSLKLQITHLVFVWCFYFLLFSLILFLYL